MPPWTIPWYCLSIPGASSKAARSGDLKEVIAQIKAASEAAEKLRSFVLSERPGASWQTRQELDALLEKIDKDIQIRTHAFSSARPRGRVRARNCHASPRSSAYNK